MKRFLSTFMVVAGVACVSVFSACSKDDDNNNNNAPARTKEIRLYNTSTGSAVDAGSVTFTQLPDSTASATINLAAGYRINGVSMPASIITTVSGSVLSYAILNNVDGTTGTSTTSPIKGSDNIAIKYDSVITRTGFIVRVMSGAAVQAQGTIQ